jgi:hypothetical protein
VRSDIRMLSIRRSTSPYEEERDRWPFLSRSVWHDSSYRNRRRFKDRISDTIKGVDAKRVSFRSSLENVELPEEVINAALPDLQQIFGKGRADN